MLRNAARLRYGAAAAGYVLLGSSLPKVNNLHSVCWTVEEDWNQAAALHYPLKRAKWTWFKGKILPARPYDVDR